MFALLKKIGVLLAAPLVAIMLFAGCEDDPILGPNDGDTNGGSYGNLRLKPQETTVGTTSVSKTTVSKSSVDKSSVDKRSEGKSNMGKAGATNAPAVTSPNPLIF